MISAKVAHQKSVAEYEDNWGAKALVSHAELAIDGSIQDGRFRVHLDIGNYRRQIVRDLQDQLIEEGYGAFLEEDELTIIWE